MKNSKPAFPPASFNQMRQLPVLIQRGDLDLSLGKQSYRALCSMMDDPQLVAVSNISTLATALSVSAPTLTRLAKLLGFAGFPQLQAIFRRHLTEPDHFYSAQAKVLVQAEADSGMTLLQTLANESQENIRRGISQLNPEELASAVQWLAAGSQVHILGYRQSAALASFMSYGLSMIRSQVQLMGAHGQGLSIDLSQIRRKDVLVLFGSSPYSRETVLAAKLSKRQFARVIAITDSHLSPLSRWADISLILPTTSLFYSNSLSATIFIIEALLSLVAKHLGPRAVQNLEKREMLINELNDQV
jgi:DNA-binding MurR/RpiR family transcriptional regulator